MGVFEAAQESRLAALRATRDALAMAVDAAVDGVNPGTLAQTVAQLRAVLAEIDDLSPATVKETGLSDFERRLRERESGSKTPRRSKGV